MREVYFHEDDYCQLELVPEQNWDFCAEQMGKINEFAAAHKAEVGWTDVYVRPDNPPPLSSVNITRAGFAQCMPAAMAPFDRVFTGYGAFRSECKRTIAFGPHSSLVLFADVDENDVVRAAWFTFDLRSLQDVAIAVELVRGLGRWPLLIADWGWSQLFRVSSVESLTQYFHKRFEVFSRPIVGADPKRPWWKFW